MRPRGSFTAILLAIALVLLPQFGPFLSAQTAPPTPEELDQLLAPVALYPDSLLSQITTASTNPQEILDVDNWLGQNPGLTGSALTDAAQQQGFDPAFIALVNFPEVLEMMAQHIDDYAAIGVAFSADQGAVSASIQRLRDHAYSAGTLRSREQQKVELQQASGQTIYVIQPANPQVVYVPVYDPTVVYIRGGAPSVVSFGVGIGIGALVVSNQPWGWGGWGWNWGARRAYYNHGYWGGWSNPYRPPRPWYRQRPIVWANRPGYRGNWHYRPNGYRPPRPGNRPGSHKPYGPGNRPGSRPPANRPSQPTRPGTPNRPNPKPGPGTTPGTKPAPNPGRGRSTTPGGNRPTPAPSKPSLIVHQLGLHQINQNPHPRVDRSRRNQRRIAQQDNLQLNRDPEVDRSRRNARPTGHRTRRRVSQSLRPRLDLNGRNQHRNRKPMTSHIRRSLRVRLAPWCCRFRPHTAPTCVWSWNHNLHAQITLTPRKAGETSCTFEPYFYFCH